MSSRRFRPKSLEQKPFRQDPETYLKIRGVTPKPWGETFGEIFERIYSTATRTRNLVRFTQDQIDFMRAANRVVLDYIVDLALWVERKDEKPYLKDVGQQLASYVKQARDFELQYDLNGATLVDFVRYHCTTYWHHLKELTERAQEARKLASKPSETVVKVDITVEIKVPTTPGKAKAFVQEQGCKLLFDVEGPSRITSVRTVEKPGKPKKRKVIKKPKKIKKRKRRKA